MKKFFKISGITIGVLLLAMVLLPFLFKDKIKGIIDEQIQKNINGSVWYNSESFSLSLFSHFPNLSVSIQDIGLMSNVQEFKGDTLFAAKEFSLTLDIMSVISGDKIKIKGVFLDQPKIVTIFDKSGKMSWDITYPDTTTQTTPSEESSPLNISIEKWEIKDGFIIYDDQTMPMYAELKHFDHTGSGDIASDIYDLKTYTKTTNVLVEYDGTRYLSGQTFTADATVKIDMAKSIYTFLENEFALNDFKLGFDGSVEMPGDDIKMNITYKAKETDFKNLLSLVPAVYNKDFEKVKTDGSIGFDGYVKGIYNENTLPGFGLNMLIKNGFFQYPDLPDAVKNINMDLSVDDKDGIIDNVIVNLKAFHMEMGANPIDARVLMNGMNPYDIDANVLAKVKLEDVSKFYPIEGTTLKGLFGMDVKAKGKYSDSLKLMPMVTANMNLANGYVKSSEFPEPIENINLSAVATSDGNMKTSTFLLDYFKLILDGEPFEMKAFVKNFDDPNYEATIKGIIDLAKMTKIYPIEGTTLTGRMNADMTTKGILSEVQAGNYVNTQTSGSLDIDDLIYKSTDLPQGYTMKKGYLTLTPERFNISTMQGMLGKSDYNITGFMSNYMGYMFGGKDTTIHGVMTMKSNKFDVNEWMADEPTSTTASTPPAEEVPMEIVEVPKNIDFTFNADMNQVIYSNMDLANMKGAIIVKNGIVTMDKLNFNSLGGSFLFSGDYNTQDMAKPSFKMDMVMKDVAAKEAYKTFNSVKKMAPIANYVDGNVNLSLVMGGLLDKEMMPVYATLNGKGSLGSSSLKVLSNPLLGTIATLTRMKNMDPLEIKDLLLNFKIENGSLVVAPFDIKSGESKIAITKGLNKLDGSVDYDMQLTTPSGALGDEANKALSGLIGTSAISMPKNIIIDLNVKGPYDNTKVSIIKTNFGEVNKADIKDAVVSGIKNSEQGKQVQAEIDKTKAQAEAEVEKQKAAAQAELKKQEDAANAEIAKQKAAVQAELQRKQKAAEDSIKKSAADALKNKFKMK
ncbi:AsmA-like C-terminal region-containing protein [uncultured Cytophaga sp.]|uniref:AsmA-like C-terminal region-containing protein n=1 Tax=uncultured Cytophaga sp. TaxID=160238 RepID=UPI002618F0E0|nr:AsmA-like C-terminal region-containing protein [uncultured Cytophaga sp.]